MFVRRCLLLFVAVRFCSLSSCCWCGIDFRCLVFRVCGCSSLSVVVYCCLLFDGVLRCSVLFVVVRCFSLLYVVVVYCRALLFGVVRCWWFVVGLLMV